MTSDTLETQRQRADRVARAWIDAFNSRDLDQIMSLYHDDLVLTSEIYAKYSTGQTTLRGKAVLRDYFGIALKNFPTLSFTLQEVFPGVGSVCVLYLSSARNHRACEFMAFDRDGLITRVHAHYAH